MVPDRAGKLHVVLARQIRVDDTTFVNRNVSEDGVADVVGILGAPALANALDEGREWHPNIRRGQLLFRDLPGKTFATLHVRKSAVDQDQVGDDVGMPQSEARRDRPAERVAADVVRAGRLDCPDERQQTAAEVFNTTPTVEAPALTSRDQAVDGLVEREGGQEVP